MSNRGRKRLPTKLKIIKGTAQKCRILANEMAPEETKFVPQPPEGLNKYGVEEWNKVCPVLVELGVLTKLDHSMLFAYCMWWGKYLEYEEVLKTEGRSVRVNGVKRMHPFVSAALDSFREAKSIAQLFGFSPSSRGRIEMPKPKSVKQQSPQDLLKAI